MATMNEMRQAIMNAYPNAGLAWREHIANTKNTRQIVAIYKRITTMEKPKDEEFHQMDIFEWMLANKEEGTHTEVVV